MRLQSHAHVQAELDREPWVQLTPFGPSSTEAHSIMRRLLTSRNDPQPGPGIFQTRYAADTSGSATGRPLIALITLMTTDTHGQH